MAKTTGVFGCNYEKTREEAIKSIGENLGPLVADLSRVLHGRTMAETKVALLILLAFTIDTFDDKEAALDEVIDAIQQLVRFDQPPFRGTKYETGT